MDWEVGIEHRPDYNLRIPPMLSLMRSLRRNSTRSVRPVAAITLGAFLLASIGYPLWSGGEGKDLSQPFPCMYRHCGCRNAQQCWRGCCCFSNKQKLAWAKANGVTPPQYVAAAAERETTKPAKASCCSTKKSDSCHVAVAQPAQDELSLTAVIEALTCMSVLDQWVALGAIDIVRPETRQLELPLCGRVACANVAYSADAAAPAPPPPWS
jgi:hypothetical protein